MYSFYKLHSYHSKFNYAKSSGKFEHSKFIVNLSSDIVIPISNSKLFESKSKFPSNFSQHFYIPCLNDFDFSSVRFDAQRAVFFDSASLAENGFVFKPDAH